MVALRLATLCVLLAPFALTQRENVNPVIMIDIFRAMQVDKRDKFVLEDDDLADLGGVVKYVMSEALAESEVGHAEGPGGFIGPWPNSRKYDIDGVVRSRFKVHTSMDVISVAGQRCDFGPFVTFDNGISTNPSFIKYTKAYGEYVGLQMQPAGGRVATGINLPIYWFSATGLCPNLAWGHKGTRESPDPDCMRYGWKTPESAQNPQCTTPCSGVYPDCPNWPKECYEKVIGGLCDDGRGDKLIPDVNPTGRAGCAYSYGKPDYILWDDVVGLKEEDCGGRKCTDWKDFRTHCTNADYKRRFDVSGNIINATVCVEYDMHPTCRLGQACDSVECQKLLSDGTNIEVGLPYWRGRCDPDANRRRMESLMVAFKLEGAGESHLLVDGALLREPLYQPCYRPGEMQPQIVCKPNPEKGGPYCYRGFSGVCQPCFVPGTKSTDPLAAANPRCPIEALAMPEYVNKSYGPFGKPACKTNKVSDVCCLYTKSCEGNDDPDTADLNDEGLALVAARQSTEDMKKYLIRVSADANLKPIAGTAFDAFAYNSWLPIPEFKSLAALKTNLRQCKECVVPGPTTTAPPGEEPGPGPPITTIIVVILLLVALVVGIACFLKRKTAPVRTEVPSTGVEQQLSSSYVNNFTSPLNG